VRLDGAVAYLARDRDRLLRQLARLGQIAPQHQDLRQRPKDARALGAGRLRGHQLHGARVLLGGLAVASAGPEVARQPLARHGRGYGIGFADQVQHALTQCGRPLGVPAEVGELGGAAHQVDQRRPADALGLVDAIP
jgi:hypothetical protein